MRVKQMSHLCHYISEGIHFLYSIFTASSAHTHLLSALQSAFDMFHLSLLFLKIPFKLLHLKLLLLKLQQERTYCNFNKWLIQY